MRFGLDLKFSSFTYLFDESAMCAGFGGWKLLSKKGRLLLISGWIRSTFPLFREVITFVIENSKKSH